MKRTTSRTGSPLRQWRVSRKLSTYQAANCLGITQTRYSRLERKKGVVFGDDLKRILAVTGVPIETLVGAA